MNDTPRPWTASALLLLVYIGAAFTFLIAAEQFIAASIIGSHSGTDSIQSALVDAGVYPSYASQAQSIVLVAIGTLTDIMWVIQGRWFSGLMLTIYDVAILVLAFAPATVAYCRRRQA